MLLTGDLTKQILDAKKVQSAVIFVSVNDAYPTQIMYSRKNAEEKLYKALARRDEETPSPSLYPAQKAIPVIGFNNKYYVIDGHHSVVATKLGGYSLIPIRMIDIYHGDEHTFWQWMQNMHYAYLFDCKGKPTPPIGSFDELVDEPLRYFVARAAKKSDGTPDSKKSTGPHNPLWIKIDKSVPFIEFKIAALLSELGFEYNYDDDIERKIEEARSLLTKNLAASDLIRQLPFVLTEPQEGQQSATREHTAPKPHPFS